MRACLIIISLLSLSGCALDAQGLGANFSPPSLSGYREAGQLRDREQYYLRLTQLQPSAAEPWFQLGNLYADQNRLDEAANAFSEVLRREDRPQARYNLGLIQVRQGLRLIAQANHDLPAQDVDADETRQVLQALMQYELR